MLTAPDGTTAAAGVHPLLTTEIGQQGSRAGRRRGPGQMPTAKKKPARKPAPRRARRSAPQLHLPTLEQRQLDLIGLGLVALALFFGFLVYAGWDGGRAGSNAVEGLRGLLGAAHYLVPVALAAGRGGPAFG